MVIFNERDSLPLYLLSLKIMVGLGLGLVWSSSMILVRREFYFSRFMILVLSFMFSVVR